MDEEVEAPTMPNPWAREQAMTFAIQLAGLNGAHDTKSVITAAASIAAFINGEQSNG